MFKVQELCLMVIWKNTEGSTASNISLTTILKNGNGKVWDYYKKPGNKVCF